MGKLREINAKANEFVMGCLAEAQCTGGGIAQSLAKHKRKLNIVGYGLFGLILNSRRFYNYPQGYL